MFVLALTAAFVSASHAAAPDLTTSFTAPTGVYVYQSAMWQATVKNVGNKDASSVVLTVQLPVTHTSPTVYVMGTLGAKSATCSASGTKLVCNVGTVRKSKSTTVYFYLTLPEAAEDLNFTATASTSGESNTGNNGSAATAALDNYTPTFTPAVDVTNRHCTGTALTSFFECEKYPSSISEHDATFNADGSLSLPDDASYTGEWSRVDAELSFIYIDSTGATVAEFVGYGVDTTGCWEGVTTFDGPATAMLLMF